MIYVYEISLLLAFEEAGVFKAMLIVGSFGFVEVIHVQLPDK